MSDPFVSPYIQLAPVPATVQIVDADAPGGAVTINASDFDPDTMTVVGTEPKAKRAPKA